MRAVAAAFAIFVAVQSTNAQADDGPPPSGSPFRYDDDVSSYAGRDDLYARLKRLEFDGGYASFGADLRERVEASDVALLGFRSRDAQAYDLHRLLVFGDVHLDDSARLFVQLGNHLETGRRPAAAPTDVDRLDLAQAFIDLSRPLGAGRVTLRLGRAEMSFDDGALIGLRDGPNIRQSWDGARLSYVDRGLKLDAFAVRPVANRAGVFDDRVASGQALQGIHASIDTTKAVGLDLFWYRNVKPSVAILGSSGRARTDTVGARLRMKEGSFDGSVGAIGQTGAVGARGVRAFALHGDLGRSLSRLAWTPHLAVRADVLSGGDPRGRRIGTFDALYPNVAYSTEATIEAPSNLVEVGLVGKASPSKRVDLQYTLERLWRYSTRDAFYAAPLIPLVAPDGSNDRRLGTEQQLSVRWRASGFVTLQAALARFGPSSFIRRAGGSSETFGTVSLAVRL